MQCRHFGIDIIQRFAVEYLYNNRLIRLHSKRPDGYQDFSDFKASIWPSQSLWPGKRYYIDIEVDNITDSYFIDTGLRQAAVKLPASRAEQSRRRLDEDIIVSQLGVYPAKTNNVWVELGNRAGSQKAFYSDNDEEPYTVNPINVFTQDLLIDRRTQISAVSLVVARPRQDAAQCFADTLHVQFTAVCLPSKCLQQQRRLCRRQYYVISQQFYPRGSVLSGSVGQFCQGCRRVMARPDTEYRCRTSSKILEFHRFLPARHHNLCFIVV